MKLDKTTVLGLALVAISAAVLTFTTLRLLALSCGFSEWLSWLVPVTVDAAGLVALRVWLRDPLPYAKKLTMVCIGLSVAGNATQHGLVAYRLAVPWWVIVVVSAVPPSMLAAVVHLAHKVAQPEADEQPTGQRLQPELPTLESSPVVDDTPAVQPETMLPPDANLPPLLAEPDPQRLHLAPPPKPSPGVKPWGARARELMNEDVPRSTAYTRAEKEWRADNPGETA